jgi:hypothetical protein
MLLWRDFIYTENCRGYARKSSKLFCNSAPKVEQYYLPSVYNLPSWCEHQIHFFTRLCCLHAFISQHHFLSSLFLLFSSYCSELLPIPFPLLNFSSKLHLFRFFLLHSTCFFILSNFWGCSLYGHAFSIHFLDS